MRRLLELVQDVRRECSITSNWCDDILEPILQKGDISSCDNWRGIPLLHGCC